MSDLIDRSLSPDPSPHQTPADLKTIITTMHPGPHGVGTTVIRSELDRADGDRA